MKSPTSRRARWSVIAVATAALLGSSALTATPAFADAAIGGTVLDAGAPVENVEVDILKYNTVDRYWQYVTFASTAANGTWTKTYPFADGTYSLFYYVNLTTSAYSTNQGPNGELSESKITAQFTVTGGVASATTFAKTLLRNAGVLQVHLTTEAGAPIVGDAVDGFGSFYLYNRYSEQEGFAGNSINLYESDVAWDGVLSIGHVAAGTYYSGSADAEDADANPFEVYNLSPVTVVAAATNDFTYKLVPDPSPDVTDPLPSVSGVAKVGSVLTALTSPSAATLTYQWYSGDYPIPGASAQTFIPTIRQLGAPLAVRVFSNQAGHANDYDYSDDTLPVAVGDPDAATVAISGSARLGGKLKATVASPLSGTVAYQWYRNGAVIAGEDGSSFDVAKADLGKSIFVSIKSTTQGHSDAVVPSAAIVVAKETVSLKATTDKTIKTKTVPKVKVTVKPSKSAIGATAKVKVYYTSKKFKSVTVKSGKSATVKLPKLKKGTTTLKIVYPGTTYYNAKTVTIKVKVTK